MDSGRRHESSGSAAKHFITHDKGISQGLVWTSCDYSFPSRLTGMIEGPIQAPARKWVVLSESAVFGGFSASTVSWRKTAVCLGERDLISQACSLKTTMRNVPDTALHFGDTQQEYAEVLRAHGGLPLPTKWTRYLAITQQVGVITVSLLKPHHKRILSPTY